MLALRCKKEHELDSVCMAEKFVLFHDTKYRIGLAYHEYWCPV